MNPWEKYAGQTPTPETPPWEKYGAKPDTPAADQPPQSTAAFIGGNLSKGVADVAGLPVDLANAAIEGTKGAINKVAGTHLTQTEAPVGGSEWIKNQLTKIGAIGPSAEPRTTAQRYAAAALEAGPTAAIPLGGGNALARIGSAVGSGLGAQAGKEAGGGVAGQLVGGMLGGAVGGLAGAERGMPKPPTEAARASQASGIPLTLGQETGSTSLKFTENRLRELFPSKGVANADELAQVTAGANRVEELAGQMSQVKADPELIGNELRTAYSNTVKKIDAMRSSQAAADYGAVRQMAKGQKVIGYRNTLDTLDKIIAENQNVPAGDAVKIAKQATQIRDLLEKQNTATVEDAMKTRSAWGKAAARSNNVFSDIDPNANQVLAKRLFSAINQDFNAASTGSTPIAQALAKANQNYAKASQSIDFIKKSALGKLLGEDVTDAAFSGQTASTKAPEAIARRYLNMNPSEARSVTAILQQHDPAVLDDVKAFVLRNGLEQARNEVPGGPPISFSKFRSQIDKVQPKLEEMGFSKKEIQDIKDVTDTMARAGDRTGTNPSGTTAGGHMLATATAIGAGHPVGAAASMAVPYITAKALLTPTGRELLRKSVTAVDPAAKAAAIGALRGLYGPVSGAMNPISPDTSRLASPPQ